MITKIIEVTNGPQNWGKFLVGRFNKEWRRRSAIPVLAEADCPIEQRSNLPLLVVIGHTPAHIMVFDLQTCEGAMFRPGGSPHADLEKHKIWVCPLFEPFLGWLYKQDLTELDKLPDFIDLPKAPFAFFGYRRAGQTVIADRERHDG